MSGSHQHASSRAGARHFGSLAAAFALVAVFMVVEFMTALTTGSLALISDAGHMATDALGMGMALAAVAAANRMDVSGNRTYGLYRLEILAALANAVLLFGVASYVLFEAFARLDNPPEVVTGPMLVVAVAGLLVNLIGWRLLREGAQESINLEGAFLEVMADLIGSAGAIAAALLVRYAGWAYADPIIGAAIGLFILPRAWRLGRRALRVLIEAAPEGFDPDQLRDALSSIPGVTGIHDLHVWTLTSEMDVASVHLVTAEGTDPHPILDSAGRLLREGYNISHATLQVEPDTHEGCAGLTW